MTEEFQLARHYSPVGAGVTLLPFFATPMLVSPVAGALSDRIGRRPIIVAGLSLLTAGFAWVAWRASMGASWIGAVFAVAIGSTVFATYGGLTSPAAVTAGFKPALWTCALLAGLSR